MKTLYKITLKHAFLLIVAIVISTNFAIADEKDEMMKKDTNYVAVEQNLKLEKWMFSATYLSYNKQPDMAETKLEIESWMLQPISKTETEKELELENWMYKPLNNVNTLNKIATNN